MTEMLLSEPRIESLWEEVKRSPGIIGLLDCSSKEKFFWLLTSASHILEYSFGFVRISDMHEGKYAIAHGMFWSPAVFRNVDKLREDAMMVIQKHNLQYLCIIVPDYSRSLRHLVTEIGFTKGPLLDNYYEIPYGRVNGQVYYLSRED